MDSRPLVTYRAQLRTGSFTPRVQRMDTASTVELLLVLGRVRKLLPTVPASFPFSRCWMSFISGFVRRVDFRWFEEAILVALMIPSPHRRAGSSSSALSWSMKPVLPVRAGSRLSRMASSSGWKSSPISGIALCR